MNANETLAKETHKLLLVHSGLAILLGFALATAPRQLLALLPWFEPKPDTAMVCLLSLVGIVLIGTGLPLWILPTPAMEDHQERSLSFLAHALVFAWLLLPVLPGFPGGTGPFVNLFIIVVFWALFYIFLRFGTPGSTASRVEALSELAARQERSRLARDLHDSIKQQLFSIKMSSAAAEERWDRDSGGARAALADVSRSAHYAMVEMQAMLAQLRPEPLATVGLVDALREQCEALGYRLGIPVDLTVGDLPEDERLPVSTQENLFRIAQEALSNVARHARPRSVQVRLEADGRDLRLSIRDDGQGFDPAAPSAGMGLRSMRERLESLGGALEIDSAPGGGTRLSASVTLAPSASKDANADFAFLIKLAVFPAVMSLFIDSPEPFWAAVALYFTGQGSLKVYRAESKGLGVELGRLFHQQLFFISALAFWWTCAGALEPAGKLSELDWFLAMWDYIQACGPGLVAAVAGGLACWEAWRFLRLRRVRSTREPLHSPWLFAAVSGLFLVSIPCLWLADPVMTATVASRLASVLYLAWFLRFLATGVRP